MPALKLNYRVDVFFVFFVLQVKTLSSLLRPSNTDFLVMHKFLRHAGFFLTLVTKSMAQYILQTGRIKVRSIKNSIFSIQFYMIRSIV